MDHADEPALVDAQAQRMALEFNRERENVFRSWNEDLRNALQPTFGNGAARPRSLGALMRHYARNNDFLYGVVNPIYSVQWASLCLPMNYGPS